MPDYQKMYALLCGATSDAIDALAPYPEAAITRRMLQAALREAEELYLAAPEPHPVEGTNLVLFDGDSKAGITK
ncbi:MAG: hypothetical protein PHO10_05315 [Gemmiger sp.]|nr:hypothetical protein [Gemmiger sp.]